MKISIIIIFSFLFTIDISKAQNIDTLSNFVNTNEEIFWKIISKNYPFSETEIENYKDNIDFLILSTNVKIKWNSDLIKRYESSLSPELFLQRNKSVLWDETLIKEFVSREWFDWFEIIFNREVTISKELFEKEKHNFINTKYLIRETSDSLTFYYKYNFTNKFQVFEDFLDVPWYEEFDTLNFKNHNIFKQYYKKPINEIPVSIFISFKEDFTWWALTGFGNFNWTWKMFQDLYPLLNQNSLYDNNQLYENLFQPFIDSEKLSLLNSSLKSKIRYYEMRKGDDNIGYTPEVKIKSTLETTKLKEILSSSDTIPQSIEVTYISVSETYEGPQRFTDIMFFQNFYGIPIFICSKKVKTILESFELPRHKIYPIKVYLDSPWYGKDTANYYLFITNNSSVLENVQLEELKLIDSRLLFDAEITPLYDSMIINNLDQFKKYLEFPYNYKNYRYQEISEIKLQNYFDLAIFKGDKVFISERLKSALQDNEVSGVKFKKNYTTNWIMPKPTENPITQLDLNFNDVKISENQKTILAYNVVKDKQKKIATNFDEVKKYYANKNFSDLDSNELKLIELEIQMNIVFPKEYRKYLISGIQPDLGWKFNEYDFYKLNEVEQAGKDWYQYIPQTYRAILIAYNGVGDYLGLLIDEKSTFKLSNVIYKFEHEIGQVIKTVEIK